MTWVSGQDYGSKATQLKQKRSLTYLVVFSVQLSSGDVCSACIWLMDPDGNFTAAQSKPERNKNPPWLASGFSSLFSSQPLFQISGGPLYYLNNILALQHFCVFPSMPRKTKKTEWLLIPSLKISHTAWSSREEGDGCCITHVGKRSIKIKGIIASLSMFCWNTTRKKKEWNQRLLPSK